ncbi:KR domain-containing protein, partial [Streptomyces sp. NPDC006668]|uniref:KR domain-containing protein n=1 Tax=Streptomyces sp. NPDC006668 TaxID=3156903 RepID=UPI0033C2CAD0
VRFAQAVQALRAEGVTSVLELGPDAVLTPMVADIDNAGTGNAAVAVPLLRRERSEPRTLLHGLAQLHTHGVPVDWQAFFPQTGARRVGLPTYAFKQNSYWLTTDPADTAAGPGLTPTGHPLLGTALALADSDELVFTSRVSARTHPWLGRHTVLGSVVLSAAGLVETAVRAGDETGATVLEELSLLAPLVLPAQGAVQLQVRLGAPDDDGRRTLTVHARPDSEGDDPPWTVYAQGRLATDDLEEAANDHGTRATEGTGDGLVTEAELSAELAHEAGWFSLHPELLDTLLLGHPFGEEAGSVTVPVEWRGVRLHATGAGAVRAVTTRTGDRTVALTVTDRQGRLVATVDSLTYRAIPEERFAPAEDRAADALLRVEWAPLDATGPTASVTWATVGTDGAEDLAAVGKAAEAGAPVDAVVVPWASEDDGESGGVLYDAVRRALLLVRDWLADERLAGTRLLVVTRGGAAVADEGTAAPADPAAAAVRGLLRSAQSEAGGRIVLVDADPSDDALSTRPVHGQDPDGTAVAGVPSALLASLLASGEPEVAVRHGRLLVPRLRRVRQPAPAPAPALDPDGTVLVTGGAGLGGFLARHLVSRHGARHLLFVGPEGDRAPGAADLAAELAALGAHVTFAACDAADRDALAAALARTPDGHPLTAVIHAAGPGDGGTVQGVSLDCLDAALRTTADAARNLHELTRTRPPATFVLCSSTAGTAAGTGQVYRAAADAYLDALARRRSADGLPALSLAWGPWERTGQADGTDRDRSSRSGFWVLTPEAAAAAFDAALATAAPRPPAGHPEPRDAAVSAVPGSPDAGEATDGRGARPVLLAAPVDPAALRARDGGVPPLFRGLVRGPLRPALDAAVPEAPHPGETLAQRLTGLDDDERQRIVRDLVRRETAAVLGHPDPAAVSLQRPFQEAGFDSMAAVQLRNQLGAATRLALPATVVFDHPTPAALTAFLLAQATAQGDAGGTAARPPLLAQLDRLEATVAELSPGAQDLDRTLLGARLRTILERLDPAGAQKPAQERSQDAASRIAAASTDEIFDFIDTELGRGSSR